MIESFKFSFLTTKETKSTKCETGEQVKVDKLAFVVLVGLFHLSTIKTQF